MKQLNILVVGTGMYTCGRGTKAYGTILPAVCELKRRGRVGKLFIAGKSKAGIRAAKMKVKELSSLTGVDLPAEYFAVDAGNEASYKKALSAIPRPACAIIAIPDHLHKGAALYTIGNGLHTLVVKPLAPTVRDVFELIKKQSGSGLYCAVEFHKRYDLANIKLRDVINKGTLGDLLYFRVEYSQRKSVPSNIFKEWVCHTNIFQYLGIHYVDIIYFATGARPLRAMALGQKYWLAQKGVDTYDAIQAVVEWRMASGKKFVSHILTNWIDPENTTAMSDQKIAVIGTRGRLESDQKKRGITIVTDDHGQEDLNPYFCSAYGSSGSASYMGYGIESITQYFQDVSDIENGTARLDDLENSRPTFRQSIVPTKVLEAVNASLNKNGNWVNIKE